MLKRPNKTVRQQSEKSDKLTFEDFADKILKWGYVGVAFMVLSCAIVMSVYLWSLYKESNTKNKIIGHSLNYEKAIPTEPVTNNVDSLKNRIDILQNTINQLQQNSASIVLEQAVLKDDVRQETNNIINKVNAWIAFWITVLTFLSIFLPLITQYKNFKEEAKMIDNKLRDLQEEKGKLEKAREELMNETHHLRMNAMSHTVQNCIAYSLNCELRNYDDFVQRRWTKTMNEFSKLVTFIFKDCKSFQELSLKGTKPEIISKHEEQLLISLLDILILLTHIFRESNEKIISHRAYELNRSRLMRLINEVANGSTYTSTLHTQLTSIIDELSHIYN